MTSLAPGHCRRPSETTAEYIELVEESAATGAYAPLIEMLAAPFRATVIRELP